MRESSQMIAIVTTARENLQGGGVPVFVVKSPEALQMISSTLENTLGASVHELDQQTMIIVKH